MAASAEEREEGLALGAGGGGLGGRGEEGGVGGRGGVQLLQQLPARHAPQHLLPHLLRQFRVLGAQELEQGERGCWRSADEELRNTEMPPFDKPVIVRQSRLCIHET